MWKEFQKKHKIDSMIDNVITQELKFDKVTKVQNIAIPYFIQNKDVVVKAITGSGKTLSYLIPLFQKLIMQKVHIKDIDKDESDTKIDHTNKVYALIMLPSRELAIQVYNITMSFIQHIKMFSAGLFIGGNKIQHDLDKLHIQIPNIIIATPGRLYDLDDKLSLNFRDLELLILDEADKMLELGYEIKIMSILSKLPKQRRTGVFSATVNSQIENLVKIGMRNPVFINVRISNNKSRKTKEMDIFAKDVDFSKDADFEVFEDFFENSEVLNNIFQETPKQLKNQYIDIMSYKYKIPILVNLLKEYFLKEEKAKIFIFFSSCNAVDYFSIILPRLIQDVPFYKLHSKISQQKRKKEYKSFYNSEKGVLLTTDLAARGIDIPNINLIIQFDPPKNEEIYIHRVGRTARAGHDGESILFLSPSEEKFITYMKNKDIKITKYPIEFNETIYNDLLSSIKDLNKEDKWIYDKATKAFVTFVRFYSEHDLKYIFDVNTLDLGNLANCFQLFRIPRIREIIGKKVENFEQSAENPNDLKYNDKNIEKQMLMKQEKIQKKQEERKLKKEFAELSKKEKKKNRTRREKKDAKIKNTMQDWEDLANEEKLYKKYRQGKITKEQYETLVYKNIK